jgi:hypothetical protein
MEEIESLPMKRLQVSWGHLDYPDQIRALDIISQLIEEQQDPFMKVVLEAAVAELKMWSNVPRDPPNDDIKKGMVH